jgi:hypothetical protein
MADPRSYARSGCLYLGWKRAGRLGLVEEREDLLMPPLPHQAEAEGAGAGFQRRLVVVGAVEEEVEEDRLRLLVQGAAGAAAGEVGLPPRRDEVGAAEAPQQHYPVEAVEEEPKVCGSRDVQAAEGVLMPHCLDERGEAEVSEHAMLVAQEVVAVLLLPVERGEVEERATQVEKAVAAEPASLTSWEQAGVVLSSSAAARVADLPSA